MVFAKVIRKLKFSSWLMAGSLGIWAEKFFIKQFRSQTSHPPIFILGVPRSGTTVIYQYLANRYDVGFFTNFHEILFRSVFLAEYIYKLLPEKLKNYEFKSLHGRSKELFAPSEAGVWWYKHFKNEASPCEIGNFVTSQKILNKELVNICNISEKPFLFKNLMCCHRIEALEALEIKPVYVYVKRDKLATVKSLLRARLALHGSFHGEFSVPYRKKDDNIVEDPIKDVVNQVKSIDGVLERKLLNETIRSRVVTIKYEEFCQNPAVQAERLRDKLLSFQYNVKIKNHLSVDRFEIPKSECQLSPEIENYILTLLRQDPKPSHEK